MFRRIINTTYRLKHRALVLLLSLVAMVFSQSVCAMSDAVLFQHAREAYNSRNESALA